MVDSHAALTKRHKASLQSFIDKNDWIQSKIDYLERSTLPAIDAEDHSLDEAALAQLLQEHDRTEAEVQDLNNGELRALRLLAKAASSHNNLSPEDTDLIEITLKVLFSVDKLLHLLRIRGKELYLLQLKTKWTASVKKVEADCHTILYEVLPKFVNKARWKEPQDSEGHEKRQARLSNASVPSNSSKQASPSSTRGTMTNSNMARQMRAEILSLDLAALTSRIHTLSHSTLAASSKILDTMVDTSLLPLPETFLDLQDELEARIKRELFGIIDFCQALTSQWKQSDVLYWICRDLQLSSEVLARDIYQATLKLPSEILADTFQQRLHAMLSIYDAACIPMVRALPAPVLQAQLPDQPTHNEQILATLELTTQDSSTCLNRCRQAVETYRVAAHALAAAQVYHSQINDVLATVRQHFQNLERVPFEISSLSDSSLDLDAAASSIRALSQIAEHAQNLLDLKSQNIMLDLLNAGIDPNVRRSLQDSISALQGYVKQALHVSRLEYDKLLALNQLRETLALFANDCNQLLELENNVKDFIEHALDRESESDPHSAVELDAQAVRLRLQIAEHMAICSVAEDSLGGLSSAMSHEVTLLQYYLQKRVSEVQEQAKTMQNLLDLLQQALSQREEIGLARARATELQDDSEKLHTALVSTPLDAVDLQEFTSRHERLHSRFKAFKASLVSDVSFLSRSTPTSGFDLASHDQSVRLLLNEMSAGIESSDHRIAREVEALRKVIEAKEQLQAEKVHLEVITAQCEGLRPSIHLVSGERLKQLETAKSGILSSLDDFAENVNLQIEGDERTQASRDLVSITTSLRVSRETVFQTLKSMLCVVETELSVEKARQIAIKAEEAEAIAAKAAGETAFRADMAELDMLEKSARLTSESAASMLEQVKKGVSRGLDSKQDELDELHNRVDTHCVQADDLRKGLSLFTDRYSGIDNSVDSDPKDRRSVRIAELEKAVNDSLKAATELRHAEKEALTMHGAAKRPGERIVESEQMESLQEQLEDAEIARVAVSSAKAAEEDASQVQELQEVPCNLSQRLKQQDMQGEPQSSDLSRDSDAAFSPSEDVFGPRLSTNSGLQKSSASPSSVSEQDSPDATLGQPEECQTIVIENKDLQGGTAGTANVGHNRNEARSALLHSSEIGDVVYQVSMFQTAAIAADDAISRTMDLVDEFEENVNMGTSLDIDTDQVQDTLRAAEEAALSLDTNSYVQNRLLHLQAVWHGLQEHIDALQDQRRGKSIRSTSLSRASSSSSVPITSRRSASSQGSSRKGPDGTECEPTRPPSTGSSLRLPVAAIRARKQSLASVTSAVTSPAPSRLPRPMSASSKTFQSPTVASASRKHPTSKRYSTLSPFGIPRLPTPISSRGFSTQAKQDQAALPSPHRHRASNRRSSAGHSVDLDAKPNCYQPKPNHKLDMAVGKIVNNMPIPVTVTPAEVHRDEVGKYYIGVPPKLYYARILRSRTVMLRVGGGWQELGSFLSTHFDQVFSTGDCIKPDSTEFGNDGASTPKLLNEHAPTGDVPWLSSSSMKASQSGFSSRRQSFKSPRSASLHISPLAKSRSGGEVPFDLAALLMRSVSRSPPVARPLTSQRNTSAPIPWKI